ncbi:probable glucan 1,3-beta-glucosidase [Phialocephala subalpina]|uniref:Probable glucan 1,3-beta-glucosidase n=1 Tax=Phialocephala subalpina TaxID=576137 RepID=A0A1L7XMG8_9HELO|nr:probable glucan 1,3-beta-glucosidase [Phialocephala subalpina]
MSSFSIIALFVALRFFVLVSGVPMPEPLPATDAAASTSSYWLANIARQGTVAYGTSGYQVFRNVQDFGAKGDGSTDDTAAINAAITAGTRCGQGCDSSTITPALVYFPPGTYMISAPLVQLYYTQFVGDAVSVPTVKATAGFAGIALIDSDPYDSNGNNWYTNQNNFFRQIRNFVLDTTLMPVSSGSGIHWQVAQATSLQNIVFNMRTDGGTANAQQGIFMDNGSGGFMTDLVFNGGKYGAFFGNQQFTTRNLTFNGCQTAIFMNWNWAWTLSGVTINNAQIGIDMANGGATGQTVGSVMLIDSKISNTPIGVSTVYSTAQGGNGTLIIDNVDFSTNVPVAVSNAASKATILAGNTKVSSWMQGRTYNGANTGLAAQGAQTAPTKPASLLTSAGNVFARSKPQYEGVAVSSFKSVKAAGAKGDGVTDDTAAIQALFNSAAATDVVYFDHGAYVITSTVTVPKNIRITGEIWPLIMAGGSSFFKDQANPKPVFQVGQPGDTGSVEMSDLIFETLGPQPGAILIEWNVAETSQGSSGMWDVHTRIGGSAGTGLQQDTCIRSPDIIQPAKAQCEGAFMLLHVTSKATIYLENNWFWVADHELDIAPHNQTNIFNGRGVLIASEQGPVWMYGTSSEHSVLYNYQLVNASNVWMGAIQTETPYFQSNPDASTPFTVNAAYNDPTFSGTSSVNKAWGLRVVDSSDVFVFGAGLYSFFDNYDQDCLTTESCQTNMVSLENSGSVYLYGLSTKASTNMVTVNGASAALDSDNRNNFCATIALFVQAAAAKLIKKCLE